MSQILELEQPLQELEGRLQAYRDYCVRKALGTEQADALLHETFPALQAKLFSCMTAWDTVQMARHPQRPYPPDLAKEIFSNFLELHGDRRYADDRAIIGGFAKLDGKPVMLILTQKGRNLKQHIECNFGSGNPEGYRKAIRLMQLADKADCPVICIVDTPGAYPGIGAEERHVGESIAYNLRESFRLHVPVISVITGEGGSGGALGLAVANRVLVMQYAYYSVITPEGCSAILWRSDSEAPRAAQALHLTSDELLRLHVADAVVPEPLGGAHRDWKAAARLLKAALLQQLAELEQLSPEALRLSRYERFRNLGAYTEEQPSNTFPIRQATEDDIRSIHEFFRPFVVKQQILERTEEDIRSSLGNFLLAETAEGALAGTIALRPFGNGLFEIRSLTVDAAQEGHGLGSRLIQSALEMARKQQATRVFTLTIRPELFQRLGFQQVCIMRFPAKVQNDCFHCPKKEQCDETALVYSL